MSGFWVETGGRKNRNRICCFLAEPYRPGEKTDCATKHNFYFWCFLPPFSTQNLDVGEMADATLADFTALRPLAPKLAKVYKPCALQIKKTELMEGAGDTDGTNKEEEGYCGMAGTSIAQAGVLRTPPPELLWGRCPTRETWVTRNGRTITGHGWAPMWAEAKPWTPRLGDIGYMPVGCRICN